MKARYTGKKFATWWGSKDYDVIIRNRFLNGSPAILQIIDPDGDVFTISQDGGKTIEKDWIIDSH